MDFDGNVRILYILSILQCQKNKTTAKLSKKNRDKRYSNRLLMVSSLKSALMLLSFLIVAQHESCSRQTISWSVIILQMLTNQYNLTAQIEQVQNTEIVWY
jgi:hypothetical protein